MDTYTLLTGATSGIGLDLAIRLSGERNLILVGRDEAKRIFAEQPYKLERLADIPEGDTITIYRSGDFTDLCRGQGR